MVLCVFDRMKADFAPPECSGQLPQVPKPISYRARIARRLVLKAQKHPRKAKMLLVKAANILGQAAKIAAKIGRREISGPHRMGKITGACAQALSEVLGEARDNALRQAANL